MATSTITRKLAGASTATTNDLAHVDIGYRCRLIAFLITITPGTFTNGDSVRAQLSVASVGSVGTNDAQGVIGEAAFSIFFTTSGMAQVAIDSGLSGLAIQLPAGTRLYLHTLQVGSSSTPVGATIHLEPY